MLSILMVFSMFYQSVHAESEEQIQPVDESNSTIEKVELIDEIDTVDELETIDSDNSELEVVEVDQTLEMHPESIQEGETIQEVHNPDVTEYRVIIGTTQDEIGLPTHLTVVYATPDLDPDTGNPILREEQEEVTWTGDETDLAQDKVYTFTSVFVDSNLAFEPMPTITVEVFGKELADSFINLPSVQEAQNFTAAKKQELRSTLITLRNKLNELNENDRLKFEAFVGISVMANFYELFEVVEGQVAERLDGDWAYLTRFEVTEIHDGTAPFDTESDPEHINYSNRQGNDASPDNRRVRTFDTVSYDISYSTAVSGEYEMIKEGYLNFELVLPVSPMHGEWEMSAMTWLGIKVNSKDELPLKTDGENYYHFSVETRVINGVEQSVQVITGKRYLIPQAPNPAAFPGSGTLNAVVRVLNMPNGSELVPQFTGWLEHNHTDGECPIHHRVEPITSIADPVQVTSELRMNVQLLPVTISYMNGLDDFDFSTGNEFALNKDAGIVRGRLTGYGATIMIYNEDPSKQLKGLAFPTGEMQFDIEFDVKYKTTSGKIIDLNEYPEYTPLVWSYEGNIGGPNQADGRIISNFGLTNAAGAAAGNGYRSQTESSQAYPEKGTLSVWNGGVYRGEQTDNVAHLG